MEQAHFPERQRIAAAQNIKERDYWLERFSPPPVKIFFPYDRQSTTAPAGDFAVYEFAFQDDLFAAMRRLSKDSDIRLHILLAAAVMFILYKYTGAVDITIGTPIYKQETAGEFINTVLVHRHKIDEQDTPRSMLLQVGKAMREAAENQNFPIEVLLQHLDIPHTPQADFPLFDVSLVLVNIQDEEHIRHIRHNMIFSFERTQERLIGRLRYNAASYDEETAQHIAQRLPLLLENILAGMETPISRIEMISEAEQRQILEEFNAPQVDFPAQGSVDRRFAEQVRQTPDRTAAAALVDLAPLFAKLESQDSAPGLLPQLARCRFAKNPYLGMGDTPYAAHPAKSSGGIKIIKTPRHNSVVVGGSVAHLLDNFDGRTGLAEIFSRVSGKQHDFWLYDVAADDLLEITANLEMMPQRFAPHTFEEFIALVKTLYRCSLIQLTGLAAAPATGDIVPAQEPPTAPGETPPALADLTLHRLLNAGKTPAQAQVLLLGDTPGMASTGLLYLASYLRRSGISAVCRFNDTTQDYQAMKTDIKALLGRIQPKIAALSMKWFLYIDRVLEMCRIIKEYAAQHDLSIEIVVGGNTASFYRQEIFQYDFIDYLVCGDGEIPLLKICRGEDPADIPNLMYRRDGRFFENPMDYVQDETSTQDIYLSHLDEILLDSEAAMFGTFFIYTHKGCRMNCFYCGGCHAAQVRTFNRSSVLTRPPADVRKDLLAARQYTLTFQFDFDTTDENLVEYCRELFDGIDLSSHFCVYANLTLPSPQLMKLINSTFKYVYCDIDVLSLSERHRMQLASLGMVKPQPSDERILAFFDECEKYDNVEVRVNLITGLPYFTEEDIAASEKLLAAVMDNYSCFGELHWARLHAQPGAPILENPSAHDMHSFAQGYEDFLKYSRMNFNKQAPNPRVEYFNYPYIYYNDEPMNSRVTQFYSRSNQEIRTHKQDKRTDLIISEKWTYRQLEQQAAALAFRLRQKGITPGAIVGLLVDRSLHIPQGILGILKAQCVYLPIDPGFPTGRMAYMLNDSQAAALVTTRSLYKELEAAISALPRETIFIEEDNDDSGSHLSPSRSASVQRDNHSCSTEAVAYVIYTSGTTGAPKGVLLTHKNIVNYVYWFKTKVQLTPDDKTILMSSFAFDLGYTSLYPSLLSGCELHILAREVYLSAEKLLDYIKKQEITYLKVTPSLFSMMINHSRFSPLTCRSLRFAAIGGEAINAADIEKAHALCAHIQIMNHYGPTETTIGAVAAVIDFDRFAVYSRRPHIGKPIYNVQVFILDKNQNLMPTGVPGELCIAGTGLGRGYLNRPELTAERFAFGEQGGSFRENHPPAPPAKALDKSFFGVQGAILQKSPLVAEGNKIYKTGDLARWLPDGNIEFLGRIDTQVKVRGYRIELGEIENRLLRHHKIENAVVVIKEFSSSSRNEPGIKKDKYICAYIIPKTDSRPVNRAAGKEADSAPLIGSFLERFAGHAAKIPGKIAVKFDGRELTFTALDKYSDQAARLILENYDDAGQLTKNERERYKRQMLLYGWGLESQEKLKNSTAFVAGAGGGGSAAIMQLALTGFGTIKICDFDEVELSNLNRQFLHDEERIGMNKALSAKLTIDRINPHINVIPYPQKLTRDNVFDLAGDADVIFDMFDGPADKFVLSECAVVMQIPQAIISMTDINAYTTICHTPYTPCYHCLFDRKKLETIVSGMKGYTDNYSKNPLAVAAPSLFISTAAAINETLKILLGFDRPAYNKFFYFNQRGATADLRYTPSYQSMTFLFSDFFREKCKQQGFDWDTGWRGNFLETLDIEPNPDCPICGAPGVEIRKILREKMRQAEINRGKETSPALEISLAQPAGISEKRKTVVSLLDDYLETAAGLAGTLKAGKTFVPCDPAVSPARLAEILEDCEARVILTNAKHRDLAQKLRDKVNKNINVITLDFLNNIEESMPASAAPQPAGFPQEAARMQQPSYLLYPQDDRQESIPGFNESFLALYQALATGNGAASFAPGATASRPANLNEELRAYLAAELPEYMIPTYFTAVEQIPLTPNGKLDTSALPDPQAAAERRCLPPRNQVESRLLTIWSEILEIDKEQIGVDANFFQVGGHSLKATQLLGRIQKEFNVKISLAEIFEKPRLDIMAEHIGRQESAVYETIAPAPQQRYYLLSSSQERLYVLQQLEPASTGYNLPQFIPLPGDISLEKLQRTFLLLIEHHESLRTRFLMVDEKAYQEILTPQQVEFSISHRRISPGQIEERKKILQQFIQPFDLAAAPLLRSSVVSEGEKNILLVDMHHIISDAISHSILLQDFTALYNGAVLPPLSIQYKDYAWWQRQQLTENPTIRKQEAFWLDRFADEVPVLNLPTDFVRPPIQSFAGHTIPFTLESSETTGLEKLAADSGVTMYMLLLAIFNTWLARISGQEDIVVGTPIAGRRHEELKPVIGIFLNTLVLRNFPFQTRHFPGFLAEVKQRTIAAYENQDYPFEELVNKISLPRDTGRNPLFDVMFSYLDMNISPQENTPHPFAPPAEEYQGFANPVSKFDFTLYTVEMGSTIACAVEYGIHLFKEETIHRFIAYFKQAIASVLVDSTRALKDIEIIPQAEKKRLLYDFNDTDAPYPTNMTLHGMFEQQAEKTPDHTAVTGPAPAHDAPFTYRQLDERAAQLAHVLKEKGVNPGNIAAVQVRRSPEMMIAILGILKAGAAYLPIDPDYPPARRLYLLNDSRAKVLLTTRSLVAEAEQAGNLDPKQSGGSSFETIFIEAHTAAAAASHVTAGALPADLAYVIYTSGSTGLPKGAMIRHDSAINRLHWMQKAYPLTPQDVILQKTPYIFDVSVWELFWWFFPGATQCLLAPGAEKDPGAIIDTIKKYGVTTMHFVPSMLAAFLDYFEAENIDPQKLASLKQVFASGEALDLQQVQRFYRSIGEKSAAKLINLYGPTEATVDVSYYNCPPQLEPGSTIPIGKPIDNIKLYIIDKYMNLQGIGVIGELVITGVGLGRGYLNNPESTAERFAFGEQGAFLKNRPLHPQKTFINSKSFCGGQGGSFLEKRPLALDWKFYKTGDLAKWLPDGNIEFIGRIDHQVKIRGFRIEPGEIESCLGTYEPIDKAVVIPIPGFGGSELALCAYFTAQREIAAGDIREFLSTKLPDYMIPAYFVQLENIPLTATGKVNRRALPPPTGITRSGTEFAPAATETEKKLHTIWQELLGNSTIGINDDFFSLGGNSLKAISLFSRIKKAFPDSQVILMDLFKHSTIGKMAAQLDSGQAGEFNILQALTPAAGQPISLVCIPYAGGSSATYIKMAREIAQANPQVAVYAIAIPGNDIGSPRTAAKPVTEIAAECAAEIKKQIAGPIVLYGHCVGAALTLEIARLLEKERMTLNAVCLGGALFTVELLAGNSDLWSNSSNEEIRDLMIEWGAFKKGEISKKDLIFFIGNFRKDVRLALDYYKEANKQSRQKRIAAPIWSIFSKKDPLTRRDYRLDYRKWRKFSSSVKLIVLDRGNHYFINDNTETTAAVVLQIISGKPSFRKIAGAKRKGLVI